MCEVAARSGADLVFLGLEDASALTELDWGDAVRAIRIKGLDTPWCYGDVVEVVTGARDALDVIIVPKVLTAREVWWVDVLLTQLEAQLGLTRPIALEALVEEAERLLNAQEIAKASPRLEAVILGAGDLSASLRGRVDGNFQPVGDHPGDSWHAVRMQVLAAVRAAGIPATHASLLGFDGKWAIHPDQVPIAHQVFTPTAEELAEAARSSPTTAGRRPRASERWDGRGSWSMPR
jgi:citrate lyase subunit beta / citryl-CoA lyase